MPTLFIYTLWRCMICFFSLIYCQSHTFLIDCQFQVGGPWDHDGRCMTTIISELFLSTRKEDQRGRERRPSQRHFRVRSGVVFQVRLRPFFFFLSFSCCVVLCPVKEHHFTLYKRHSPAATFSLQGDTHNTGLLLFSCCILTVQSFLHFLCYTGKKTPTYITIYIRFWKMVLSSSVLAALHRSASLHCWMTDSLTSHLRVYAQRCETETRAATNACFYYTLGGNESLEEQKRRLFVSKAPSDGNKLPSLRSVSSFRDFNYLKHYLRL